MWSQQFVITGKRICLCTSRLFPPPPDPRGYWGHMGKLLGQLREITPQLRL